MRFAIAASEAGSFRKAASRMNVKESTVSRRIRELEIALGLEIFVRLHNGVTVTPAGTAFMRMARDAIMAFDSALSRAADPLISGDSAVFPMVLEGRWIITRLAGGNARD
ncbi:LysR family transcriptional regulator [Xaviernesmea oryzae]